MTHLKPLRYPTFIILIIYLLSVNATQLQAQSTVQPFYVTEQVSYDTDDPAVWVNEENPAESLIIGTDKNEDGALYVFNLQGEIIENKVVRSLDRPNNVDVAYGLSLQGNTVDIAVTTERFAGKLRVFSLPDMQAIDGGGIEVFSGEGDSDEPMGIALYKRPSDSSIFAIVSRKSGPTDGTYLWEYQLQDDGKGNVAGTLVRKFGDFSGDQEIEAVTVDAELGYVYYADERVGVRKYHADPDSSNRELALFATNGFASDQEGIALFKYADGTGYILVSDQQADELHIYPREGTPTDPHEHPLIKEVPIAAQMTDGIEAVNYALPPDFRNGLVVAMSEGRTFHLYRWEDIAGEDLFRDSTSTEEIIPFRATWRFLDDGSDQGKAWVEPSFDDSGWDSGEAKFGYGIPDAVTVVSYGNNKSTKHITTYFRRNFILADVATYVSFPAQVNRDDGVVVYVNGQEVYRNNMPDGDISYMTYASGGTGGDDGATPIPFTIPVSAFVTGENTIAVEIHQYDPHSSDIVFDLELTGEYLEALATSDDTTWTSVSASTAAMQPGKQEFEEVKAYPNPFSGSVTISFACPKSTPYQIALYDSSGKLASQLIQGKAEKDKTNHVAFDGADLAPGLYFVRIQTTAGRYSLKLLHSKK